MDQKSIAVTVVHGTGYKDPDFAEDVAQTLQDRFPTHLPEEVRSRTDLSIQPVYWADLPHKRGKRSGNALRVLAPWTNWRFAASFLTLPASLRGRSQHGVGGGPQLPL